MPRPEAHAPSTDPAAGGDCRCECGSLLARLVDAGIELKCRRCKRVLLVAVSLGQGAAPSGTRLRVLSSGAGA